MNLIPRPAGTGTSTCEHCYRPATRERRNRAGRWVALCDRQQCLSVEWIFDDQRDGS